MLRSILIPAILLMQTTYLCRAADNEDFADYKIQALSETATLYCNSTDSNQAKAIPELYEPIAWMLPNLTTIDEDNDGQKYELQENMWTLVVRDTVIEDLGVYHCMLLNASRSNESVVTTSSYYLVKVGLNAEGPYFFDLWDRYMWPTIIGICCFFGFLLLAAIAVALFHFRYIPPKEEESESEDSEEEDKNDKSDMEAEMKAADGPVLIKVAALTDITAPSVPPYNGNASSHTYENPSFQDDHPYDTKLESDDEDLTSL